MSNPIYKASTFEFRGVLADVASGDRDALEVLREIEREVIANGVEHYPATYGSTPIERAFSAIAVACSGAKLAGFSHAASSRELFRLALVSTRVDMRKWTREQTEVVRSVERLNGRVFNPADHLMDEAGGVWANSVDMYGRAMHLYVEPCGVGTLMRAANSDI